MRIDNMVHKVVYSARNSEADAPKMNAMHKMLQSARNGEAGLIMKCLVLCRNRCLAGAVFSTHHPLRPPATRSCVLESSPFPQYKSAKP